MKGIIKLVSGLIGGIVLLLIIAAIALPLIYDNDALKQVITTQVHEATGRELKIEGDLDFSVFPWLAVEVSQLNLSNAEGFGNQPFARVGIARIGVALFPLFQKKIIVDEITLEQLELLLVVDNQGRSNWADLAAVSEPGEKESSAAEEATFSVQKIAGLNIRQSNIEYRNYQSDTHYKLSGLSMQTGALGGAEPVRFELKAALEDVRAGTVSNVALETIASIDFPAQNYTFSELDLELEPGDGSPGLALSLATPQIKADFVSQTLTVDSFVARVAGLQLFGNLSANQITDNLRFNGKLELAEFSPRELMKQLGMEEAKTTDPQALQRARMSSSFAGSSSDLSLQDLLLELDQTNFNGELSITNFKHPAIRFKLQADSLDVDRYLEPAEESTDSGNVPGDLALPSDELKDLDIQGTLKVASMRLAGLDLENASVGLTILDSILKLKPLTAGIYGGNYKGNIQIDSSGAEPTVSLDEKLDSVSFSKFMGGLANEERLSGTAVGYFRASGRGATSDELLGSLTGDLGLTLNDGALEGINVWYEIRRGLAAYKGLPAPEPEPNRTVFSRIQLDAGIDGGIVTMRELIGELPFLTLRGSGAVNLGQSSIDMRLTATVRSAPELANDPLAADLAGRQLPFRIRGSINNPEMAVDWKELLKSEATQMLLDKLLGSPKDQGSNSESQTEEEREEAGPEDVAKGLLRSLLGGDDDKDDGN